MTAGLIAHLWQSTLFAGIAWLLTLVLRKNAAQVRYRILFIASIKFLIPFSLLVGIGTLVPRRAAVSSVQTTWIQTAEPLITLPTVAARVAIVEVRANYNYVAVAALALWAGGFAAITICWLRRWNRVRAIRGSATPAGIEFAVPVLSAPDLIEPGIVGIFRPVLLLPEGIAERLDPEQFEAVLAHELCHIHRRDNLTAAIHMAVQAIFWFHPLLWWLGSKLVDERERACDEEVLRLGAKPQIYAAGILNVCKLYVETPLACVSGVTGSNLKKRIETIMKNRTVLRLNLPRKVALVIVSTVALPVPIIIGIATAPTVRAQPAAAPALKFEVAAIRPHAALAPRAMGNGEMMTVGTKLSFSGPRATIENVSLGGLIEIAYDLKIVSVAGVPHWADSVQFDITASAEGGRSYTKNEFRRMFQTLLAERFKLKFHLQTKETNGYSLVVAKNGPKLTKSEPDAESSMKLGGTNYAEMTVSKWTMEQLAFQLSLMTGHADGGSMIPTPVVDTTGIAGSYDFKLKWADDRTPNADPNFPSLFTALQEQLGLKLEPRKASAQVLVIDSADRPSAN